MEKYLLGAIKPIYWRLNPSLSLELPNNTTIKHQTPPLLCPDALVIVVKRPKIYNSS